MTWLDIFQGFVIGSTSRSFQTHTSLTIFDTASEDRKQDYNGTVLRVVQRRTRTMDVGYATDRYMSCTGSLDIPITVHLVTYCIYPAPP